MVCDISWDLSTMTATELADAVERSASCMVHNEAARRLRLLDRALEIASCGRPGFKGAHEAEAARQLAPEANT